jgi:hypothetical protein
VSGDGVFSSRQRTVRGHFHEDWTQNYLRKGMYAGTRR